MTDNEIIKALDNLHNRILGDGSFLAKVNHGELSALFHAKRILELQQAEIERLKAMHKEMCIGMKVLKKTVIKKYREKVKAILMDKGIYPVVVKNALNEAEKELVDDLNGNNL